MKFLESEILKEPIDLKTKEKFLNSILTGKRVVVKFDQSYVKNLEDSIPSSGFSQEKTILSFNNREGVVKKIVFSSYRGNDCIVQVVVGFNTGSVISAPININYISFF